MFKPPCGAVFTEKAEATPLLLHILGGNFWLESF
jgi:hypothetical protein